MNYRQPLALLVLGALLPLSSLAAGSWAEPTGTPPSNNAEPPINTSLQGQSKQGALTVGGIRSQLDAYVDGKLGIGTTNPSRKATIDVGGDQNGLDLLGSAAPEIRFGQPGSNSAHLTYNLPLYMLSLGTFGQYTNTINVSGGRVGIGTQLFGTDLKLDVEGKVGATAYCDSDGNNCKTAAELGGSTGGGGTTGGSTTPTTPAAGDNLGNHIATQNLRLEGNQIVGVNKLFVNAGAGTFSDLGARAQADSFTTKSLTLGSVTRTSWPDFITQMQEHTMNSGAGSNSYTTSDTWKACLLFSMQENASATSGACTASPVGEGDTVNGTATQWEFYVKSAQCKWVCMR